MRVRYTECFKLSPSDFAFLYEECQHCYYLKVKYGVSRPRTPMATIYKQAEGAIVNRLRTDELSSVVLGAPCARLTFGERWVRSQLIHFTDHPSTCFISGKFDLIAALGDGGYAVPDIKMSKVKDPYLQKYGRQLHSYAYALEHAERGFLVPESRSTPRLDCIRARVVRQRRTREWCTSWPAQLDRAPERR
jgi:hypothetical protein